MITKFKIFENINVAPKVGDYVIIDTDRNNCNIQVNNFLNDNIGQIVETPTSHGGTEVIYIVKFDDVSDELLRFNYFDYEYTHQYKLNKLKCWSDKKDELQTLIDSKKYNI